MTAPRLWVSVTFEADEGVTWEQAYDAAEAMVTGAPLEMGCMTFQGTEIGYSRESPGTGDPR